MGADFVYTPTVVLVADSMDVARLAWRSAPLRLEAGILPQCLVGWDHSLAVRAECEQSALEDYLDEWFPLRPYTVSLKTRLAARERFRARRRRDIRSFWARTHEPRTRPEVT